MKSNCLFSNHSLRSTWFRSDVNEYDELWYICTISILFQQKFWNILAYTSKEWTQCFYLRYIWILELTNILLFKNLYKNRVQCESEEVLKIDIVSIYESYKGYVISHLSSIDMNRPRSISPYSKYVYSYPFLFRNMFFLFLFRSYLVYKVKTKPLE